MRIFLVGFMGCGKTTIGKQLASSLNVKFIDQDQVIEEQFGMSVSDIFARKGEQTFREAENSFLHSLKDSEHMVVSTGGGAPCFYDNIQVMNNLGCTIYLKADPKTLVNRLKFSHNTRPLIKDKTEEELLNYIREKLQEREPFYTQAKVTVQAINLKASDIVRMLNEGLLPD